MVLYFCYIWHSISTTAWYAPKLRAMSIRSAIQRDRTQHCNDTHIQWSSLCKRDHKTAMVHIYIKVHVVILNVEYYKHCASLPRTQLLNMYVCITLQPHAHAANTHLCHHCSPRSQPGSHDTLVGTLPTKTLNVMETRATFIHNKKKQW